MIIFSKTKISIKRKKIDNFNKIKRWKKYLIRTNMIRKNEAAFDCRLHEQ